MKTRKDNINKHITTSNKLTAERAGTPKTEPIETDCKTCLKRKIAEIIISIIEYHFHFIILHMIPVPKAKITRNHIKAGKTVEKRPKIVKESAIIEGREASASMSILISLKAFFINVEILSKIDTKSIVTNSILITACQFPQNSQQHKRNNKRNQSKSIK